MGDLEKTRTPGFSNDKEGRKRGEKSEKLKMATVQMETGEELFLGHPVVPVVVIDEAEQAPLLAEGLLAGGIRIIEITLRTQAGLDAIRMLRERYPDVLVGAGTVVSDEQAEAALAAGAQFGLAPGTDTATIRRFAAAGVPFIPGVMTPGDIQLALREGCRLLKFFPAGPAGGPEFLKAIAAPYLARGVAFCPTGGVNPGNMATYLELPFVFAVGGTWIASREDLKNCDTAAIATKAAEAMRIARSVRS